MQSCALERWSPRIGDPSLMGWLTVGVYLLAGLVALWVLASARFPAATRGRERLFWLFVALILFFLAINKQLDLQSYLTAVGRCVAQI